MVTYPVRFKAAVLREIHKPLGIETLEFRGPLAVGQVLVRLFYSGICGKQIEEMEGLGGKDDFLPHLLGHEGSAEVVDVGPGVTKVKPGDVVVMHWRKGSGIQSATPLYHCDGARVNAGWVTTFNEMAVVSENRVTPIPAGSDLLIAALLGCAVTTGVGAVLNDANIQPYDTVAVFGCGGVGLCAIQAAASRLPQKLIAVDVNARALEAARASGADVLVNPSSGDPVQAVKDATAGKGATKVLVCTGHPAAVAAGVESTSIPGECLLVGVPPKGFQLKVDAHAVMHERNLRGSLGGGSYPDRDIPAYLSLHEKGHLRLGSLVSHVGRFEDIVEAISMMKGDTPGRVAVKFS
jgi:S-(hydroxymethyl)glutathione dehydrogenase/alcohol dehydrogenase